MPGAVFIGCGYSVQPLAAGLAAQGWSVNGTTRSVEKAAHLSSLGISSQIWSAPAPLSDAMFQPGTAIIVSAAPKDGQCPALAAIPAGALARAGRIIYLSSSSVYGDHDGAWVDEDATCAPTRPTGINRLAAEEAWEKAAFEADTSLCRCRLAGIYGPGRNALVTLLAQRDGTSRRPAQRIIKPGQVFNRICRDDIVGGLTSLLRMDAMPPIVNFADDEPAPPQGVIELAAELLGVAPPPEVSFESAELSPMGREFYMDRKRLRNDVLKGLPGFSLSAPTYREGLAALAKDINP